MPEQPEGRRSSGSWVPLGAAALALTLAAWPGTAAALTFDRTYILAGQAWRLVTGQFVHWNTQHLLLNLGGAGLLAAWLHDLPARFWLASGAGALLAVGTGLLIEPNPLDQYRGLSALLYGWLGAGLLARAYRARWLHWSLAAALVLWTLTEALGVIDERRVGAGSAAVRGSAHLYGIAGAWLGAQFGREVSGAV